MLNPSNVPLADKTAEGPRATGAPPSAWRYFVNYLDRQSFADRGKIRIELWVFGEFSVLALRQTFGTNFGLGTESDGGR